WEKNYPPAMEAKVRQQFLGALRDTYTTCRHPDGRLLDGREWPEEADLVRMYEMLMRAMKMQTSGYSIKKPKPPDYPIDFDTFPSPPEYQETSAGGRRRSDFSWSAFLESLWNFIKETAEYVAEVVKWVVDSLVATALWPFMYALYLIQLACYNIYRACRRVLALRGYVYAHPDELVGGAAISSGVAGTIAGAVLVGASNLDYDLEKSYYVPSHFLDAGYLHTEGLVNSPKLIADATKAMADASPEVKVMIQACLAAGGFPQAFQTPWVYPATPMEPDHTLSGPYPEGCLPDMFIEKAVFHADYYNALKRVTTPGQMIEIVNAASRSWRRCLGNAIDLGRAMVTDVVADGSAPDFNLDGDRGYGWLCWDVEKIGSATRKTGSFSLKEIVIGPRVGSPTP
ncbi:MAG: hypothetical protein QHJ73_12035, partial [Armatimonadota bacterium]|nr:hypothetical protein [Armatimonadota bacterium]